MFTQHKQATSVRVLQLAPYITNSYFTRNKTGFGRTVWEISENLAKNEVEVYLFTYQFTNNIQIEGVNILPYKPIDLIKNFDPPKLFHSLGILKNSEISVSLKIRSLRYFLTEDYIERLIYRVNPDLIHIHGIGMATLPFINAAIASNSPFLLTLHGLNFFDPNIPITNYERKFEKKYIELLNSKGITITVVSSGIKDRILNYFDILNPEKIIVIPNGINYEKFQLSISKEDLREKYGIPNGKKVLINIGSLIPRKNQSLLVNAIIQLPENIRNEIVCFIIGEGREREKLEGLIRSNNLEKTVILTGYMDIKKIIEYYTMSDLTVIASTSEGFGRPFIESFACGVPVLTFEDLEAVKDLYNGKCMKLVKERSADTLAKGIIEALNFSWDSFFIKEWAKQFSWSKIIKQYLDVYNNLVREFTDDERDGA